MKNQAESGAAQAQDPTVTELLSPLEYDLLMWMETHRGDVVSREMLLKNVWGYKSLGETRTVDLCVRRLRKKIGADRIRTVHGKGYLMPA